MTLEENVQLKLDGHLSDHDTVDDFRVKISFSDGKYHDITDWLWKNHPELFHKLAEKYLKELKGE
jgi:DUF971 family protein